jgi:hypothetical protein
VELVADKVEIHYRETNGIVEDAVEQFVIEIGPGDSSDESEEESD